MTLNHQSNRKKTYFAQNPAKKGLYGYSSCICWTSYSPLLDLEINILTLKMSFYHQNSMKNKLLSQQSRQEDVLHFILFCS